MKNQTIGVEIEMTGLTRAKAARVVSAHLNGFITETRDCYDTLKITAADGRVWKIMKDASVKPGNLGGEPPERFPRPRIQCWQPRQN